MGERLIEGVDPSDLLPGEILERGTQRGRTHSGHNYEKRFVSVGDVSKPEERAQLNNHLGIWDDLLKQHREWPVPLRGASNPASDDFYENHLTRTTMQHWRDNHMPYAEALYPLQRLDDAGRLFPGKEVDEHAKDIFTNAIDSIAIRARGAIHNDHLLKYADEFHGDELVAVALGAGAGVPNIDATVQVREQLGKKIRWKEYDTRYTSLELSKELFEEAGVPGEDVEIFRADYAKAFKQEADKPWSNEENSVDIVDMLGLWEYLSRERCVDAVEGAMKILKPGGILVVSNMLPDRPQLDVNQRAIGWEGVKPRTIDELIDIFHDAGVDTEGITVTLSDDGVYAVLKVTKS